MDVELGKNFPMADAQQTKTAKRKRKYTYKCREISSYKIFSMFVKFTEDNQCDASGILSPQCYEKWVESRRKVPKKPQEAFRRALTAHCRGVDGRRPFPEEVEKNLLIELRKKKPWKCFESCADCGSIGVQGFPSLGYHEKLRKAQKEATYANDVRKSVKEEDAHFLKSEPLESSMADAERLYDAQWRSIVNNEDMEVAILGKRGHYDEYDLLGDPFATDIPSFPFEDEHLDLLLPQKRTRFAVKPSCRRVSAYLTKTLLNDEQSYDVEALDATYGELAGMNYNLHQLPLEV